MAMTFPSNPTTGQQYSVSGGPTYTWDGTVWKILTPGSQFSEQQFTATAGQTSFTVSGGYVIGAVDVYRNGVKLVEGLDYTATNLSTVVLTNAAAAGDTIEVVKAAQILYADALKATNNLSDVGNAATALANLGLDRSAVLNILRVITTSSSAPNGSLNVNALGRVELNYPIGDGNPALKVNASGSSGVYRHATHALDSTLSAGQSVIHAFGKSADGYNSSYIGFRHAGDGSLSNVGTLGIWGKDHVLTWNGSGHVNMPFQPAFRAYCDGTVNIATTNTKISNYASTLFNVGGHFSNSRFTAPVAGLYAFQARHWALQGNTTPVELQITVNGGSSSVARIISSTSEYTTMYPKAVVMLQAGDYVEASTGVCSSSGQLHTSSGHTNSEFSGYLIR